MFPAFFRHDNPRAETHIVAAVQTHNLGGRVMDRGMRSAQLVALVPICLCVFVPPMLAQSARSSSAAGHTGLQTRSPCRQLRLLRERHRPGGSGRLRPRSPSGRRRGHVARLRERDCGIRKLRPRRGRHRGPSSGRHPDTSAPVETGFVDTPGLARAVAVSGDYAYVADEGEGFDLSMSPHRRRRSRSVGSVRWERPREWLCREATLTSPPQVSSASSM